MLYILWRRRSRHLTWGTRCDYGTTAATAVAVVEVTAVPHVAVRPTIAGNSRPDRRRTWDPPPSRQSRALQRVAADDASVYYCYYYYRRRSRSRGPAEGGPAKSPVVARVSTTWLLRAFSPPPFVGVFSPPTVLHTYVSRIITIVITITTTTTKRRATPLLRRCCSGRTERVPPSVGRMVEKSADFEGRSRQWWRASERWSGGRGMCAATHAHAGTLLVETAWIALCAPRRRHARRAIVCNFIHARCNTRVCVFVCVRVFVCVFMCVYAYATKLLFAPLLGTPLRFTYT